MGHARHGFELDGTFVVAVESLVCAAGRLKRGATFDRSGVSDHDLYLMWMALQLDCVPQESAVADPDKMSDVELERATAPAEAVVAQPAASRRSKR